MGAQYTLESLSALTGISVEDLVNYRVRDHVYEINGVSYCVPEG